MTLSARCRRQRRPFISKLCSNLCEGLPCPDVSSEACSRDHHELVYWYEELVDERLIF